MSSRPTSRARRPVTRLRIRVLVRIHIAHGELVALALLACPRGLRNVRLQTLVEVVRAPAGDDDCDDEEHDCNDGEDSQGFASGGVLGLALGLGGVHAHELEDEVGEGDEIDELGRMC